ncbi:hypothetical protein GYH30_021991 [Glycine max]|uniref:Uncharacterized protein n=1 Tax=Glycine max TaxID=3847 RepID=A0A0R0IW13_SOYBN|nr:hypothetical protein GYH30_021991 [Glycine max]
MNCKLENRPSYLTDSHSSFFSSHLSLCCTQNCTNTNTISLLHKLSVRTPANTHTTKNMKGFASVLQLVSSEKINILTHTVSV